MEAKRSKSRSRVDVPCLFALALVVRIALAAPQAQPGYMDAAYYFDIAANLASGHGLSENFIWNYLAQPSALPQASNSHWMPLTSLLVAPFLWLFGNSYRAAQAPMILLSALLVPLTYMVSLHWFQRRAWATLSAVLMLASSLYLPYWSAIDSFALYALIGTGVLLLSSPREQTHAITSFACGLLIGLAHLTRADGFLLFVPFLFAWWRTSRNISGLASAIVGYLLLMLPWFARNVQAFGVPLVGGSTMFMRQYDDLFSFEKTLTLSYWLDAGWASRLNVGWRALVLNVATLAGALHFVFFPFAVIGCWRERRRLVVQSTLSYLLALTFVMSFVLSLPGPRGTFLHSLTAVLPLLYVLAPVGLSACIEWIARHRASWNALQAEHVFGAAFGLLAISLSAYFYAGQIVGNSNEAGWNQRFVTYQKVEAFLHAETRDTSSPVMCINPPTYFYFNQRAAIAIPTDDALALIHAASKFGARYFIVEADHPRYLDTLYDYSVPDSRFQLRATFTDAVGAQVQLYQIVPIR